MRRKGSDTAVTPVTVNVVFQPQGRNGWTVSSTAEPPPVAPWREGGKKARLTPCADAPTQEQPDGMGTRQAPCQEQPDGMGTRQAPWKAAAEERAAQKALRPRGARGRGQARKGRWGDGEGGKDQCFQGQGNWEDWDASDTWDRDGRPGSDARSSWQPQEGQTQERGSRRAHWNRWSSWKSTAWPGSSGAAEDEDAAWQAAEDPAQEEDPDWRPKKKRGGQKKQWQRRGSAPAHDRARRAPSPSGSPRVTDGGPPAPKSEASPSTAEPAGGSSVKEEPLREGDEIKNDPACAEPARSPARSESEQRSSEADWEEPLDGRPGPGYGRGGSEPRSEPGSGAPGVFQ